MQESSGSSCCRSFAPTVGACDPCATLSLCTHAGGPCWHRTIGRTSAGDRQRWMAPRPCCHVSTMSALVVSRVVEGDENSSHQARSMRALLQRGAAGFVSQSSKCISEFPRNRAVPGPAWPCLTVPVSRMPAALALPGHVSL